MFKMSNEVYDVLKEIALTILPALAVFYTACSKACLHISNAEYRKDGDVNV